MKMKHLRLLMVLGMISPLLPAVVTIQGREATYIAPVFYLSIDHTFVTEPVFSAYLPYITTPVMLFWVLILVSSILTSLGCLSAFLRMTNRSGGTLRMGRTLIFLGALTATLLETFGLTASGIAWTIPGLAAWDSTSTAITPYYVPLIVFLASFQPLRGSLSVER